MYKINVLILTYNQELQISRALDSVLCQREYGLNKIIVSDDGSIDKTRDIIIDYQKHYPGVIELYTTAKNRGRSRIYDNFEKVESLRGKADLYCYLAGDDAFDEHWFKNIQRFIQNEQINVRDEAITIFSNWKVRYPNGTEICHVDNKIVKNKNLALKSLKLRGMISTRSIMSSAKVFERGKPVILDEGLSLAEIMFDFKQIIHSDKAYYCNCFGNVYFSNIGISTEISGQKDYYIDLIHACKRIKEVIYFNKKDQNYWDYLRLRYELLLEYSLKRFFLVFIQYITAFDFRYNRYTIKRDVKTLLRCFKHSVLGK